METDTNFSTSAIHKSLVEIRDSLKISRERGDAELHYYQTLRIFEELKSEILPLVEKEKLKGCGFAKMPIVNLLKGIDDTVCFPLIWTYKQDVPFRSVKEEFEISDCIPEVPDAPFPQDTVDCAFITDDGYVNMTAVAINSIRRTRSPETKVRIHVVAAALSEYSEKLFKLFEEKDFSVDIVRVEKSVLDRLSSYHQYIKGGHCMATPAALLKFALPELLPTLNRVLYLDGDTLVLRDLRKLFQAPLGNNYVAAVTDGWTVTALHNDNVKLLGRWRFNSGVMLLNLVQMRRDHASDFLLEAKKQSKDFRLMDQPILNKCFAGRVHFLPLEYNFLPVWYYQNEEKIASESGRNRMKGIFGAEISTPREILGSNICICHFAGTEKPWDNDKIPFAHDWLKAQRESSEVVNRAHRNGALKFPPFVSVIIPVYNTEKYLRRCLDSVLAQTLVRIEVICVDDGSTDRSSQILKEYAAKDSRVRVLRQHNSGQASARNAGLQIAQGEYIGFVDADDYVSPKMYEKLLAEARASHAEVVECSAVVVDAGGFDEKSIKGQQDSFNFESWEMSEPTKNLFLEKRFHAVLWNKIYSREFLSRFNLSFDGTLRKGEDAVFQWKVMPFVHKYRRISDKLYYYYFGRSGSTETRIEPEKTWQEFVMGSKNIRDFWERKNLIRELGDVLLWRLWNIAKWRLTYCYKGNVSGSVFREKMVEIARLFPELEDENNSMFFTSQISKNDTALLRHISKERLPRVIVCLTSFPGRIGTVNQTIETLLGQTWKADRILLWLADSQFPKKEKELPAKLLELQKRGLEIRWCGDLKSYKKLVPALKEFPNDVIVTVDDDVLYPHNWLDPLVHAYLKKPHCIQAGRAHKVSFANERTLAPYAKWEKEIGRQPPSFNNFFTGVGGCLYPPNCLHSDVLDVSKFQSLCPHGDDIWFWAMAVKKGTKINVPEESFALHFAEGTQEIALWRGNVTGGENDRALSRVLSAYPEVLEKLERIYPSATSDFTQKESNKSICEDSCSFVVPPSGNPKRLPRFLVRLGALFILNKTARKRWRAEHMDLTPKDGIDINVRPDLRRDSALKRFVVRVAALFILSKSKRRAFRAAHLDLSPKDGVDVHALSAEERRLRKQKKRERNPLRRLLNALVPASRSKISHSEKRLVRHMEWQTQQILAAVKSAQAQTERKLAELQHFQAQLKKQHDALEFRLVQEREKVQKELTDSLKNSESTLWSEIDMVLKRQKALEVTTIESYSRLEKRHPDSLEFRTFGDLAHCIRTHLHKIPADVDLVVGLPRSGMIPAYTIALFLNKKCCSLDEFLSGTDISHGCRPVASVSPRKVLVVDDSCYSGRAIDLARERLKVFADDYEFVYAAVYGRTDSLEKIDCCLEVVDGKRVWQWNYLNHSMARTACFDLDGVLCVDPTPEENDDGPKYLDFIKNAAPLYIPNYKIRAIVTSRLEKYRAQTEAWLRKHGVQYDELVMLDLPTAEERRRQNCHARFKADAYKERPETTLFVESEERQAKEIAFLSGKEVLCIATDELY